MKKLCVKSVFFPIALTTLVFVLSLFSYRPILDSDDNFYILYTLSGGYGNNPTNLLHYFYEWHPLLFWPIAELFKISPRFNWYSILLLLLQYMGSVNLLYSFSLQFSQRLATGIFLLFFLFFASPLLLSLNHSNTAFLLGLSGCSTLLLQYLNGKQVSVISWKKLVVPVTLLLFSLLLRVHALALCLILLLGIAFELLPFRYFLKMVKKPLLACVLFATLVLGHNWYYEMKIPKVKEEERFRQSLFYLVNHPTIEGKKDTGITKIKNSFIKSWLIYDTSFIGKNDIERYTKRRISNRLRYTKDNYQKLYWTVVNNRVYWLLFFLFSLFFLVANAYKQLLQWLRIVLFSLAIYAYLFVFMKVTGGILITILASLFLVGVFCLLQVNPRKMAVTYSLLFLCGLSSIWMLVLNKRRSEANIVTIQQTRGVLKELNGNKNYLFVVPHKFNDNGFSIWDTPSEYPLTNLINKELLITASYQPTLQRFGISDLMKSLPTRKDVFITGPDLPMFKEYYWLRYSWKVELVKLPGFDSLEIYQLRIVGK